MKVGETELNIVQGSDDNITITIVGKKAKIFETLTTIMAWLKILF